MDVSLIKKFKKNHAKGLNLPVFNTCWVTLLRGVEKLKWNSWNLCVPAFLGSSLHKHLNIWKSYKYSPLQFQVLITFIKYSGYVFILFYTFGQVLTKITNKPVKETRVHGWSTVDDVTPVIGHRQECCARCVLPLFALLKQVMELPFPCQSPQSTKYLKQFDLFIFCRRRFSLLGSLISNKSCSFTCESLLIV